MHALFDYPRSTTQYDRVALKQPEHRTHVSVSIPRRTSDYEQIFSPIPFTVPISDHWFSYINESTIGIDTSGLWNIEETNNCLVGTNAVALKPGFWNRDTIIKVFNGTTAGEVLSIPTEGESAFHSVIKPNATLTVTPLIAQLLGFEPSQTSIAAPATGLVSPYPVDITLGKEVVKVYCNLVIQSSPGTTTPLISTLIKSPIGTVQSTRAVADIIPLVPGQTSWASILWKLRDRDDKPISFSTPVTISLGILSVRR